MMELTAERVRLLILQHADAAGGVRALARAWKMDAPNLHKIIVGKKAPSAAVLRKVGLCRVVSVRYVPSAQYHNTHSPRAGRKEG